MLKKILTVALTLLFVELFLYLLHQSDNYAEFIPFGQLLADEWYISAYDCFLLLIAISMCGLYRFFGVAPRTVLRDIQTMFNGLQVSEAVLLVGIGLAMHFYGNPFLREIFLDLLNNVRDAPDHLRHAVLVSLPFWWLLIVGIISNRISNGPNQVTGSNHGSMHMPPPPFKP